MRCTARILALSFGLILALAPGVAQRKPCLFKGRPLFENTAERTQLTDSIVAGALVRACYQDLATLLLEDKALSDYDVQVHKHLPSRYERVMVSFPRDFNICCPVVNVSTEGVSCDPTSWFGSGYYREYCPFVWIGSAEVGAKPTDPLENLRHSAPSAAWLISSLASDSSSYLWLADGNLAEQEFVELCEEVRRCDGLDILSVEKRLVVRLERMFPNLGWNATNIEGQKRLLLMFDVEFSTVGRTLNPTTPVMLLSDPSGAITAGRISEEGDGSISCYFAAGAIGSSVILCRRASPTSSQYQLFESSDSMTDSTSTRTHVAPQRRF